MSYLWQHPDWPQFEYDSQDIHHLLYRYALESGRLAETAAALPKQLKKETSIDLIVSEAIDTMAIEGESLDRPSVVSSVKNKLGLNTPPELVNNPKVGQATTLVMSVREELRKPLSKAMLISWKKMLFGEAWSPTTINKEAWRGVEMSIIKGGKINKANDIIYEAVPLKRVDLEMSLFLDWYNDNHSEQKEGNNIQAPIKAAIAHLWFEMIHPFEDGNGRIGRAIAEHALAQELGRPSLASLSSAIQAKKADYYQALESANNGIDITAWIKYFVKTIIQSQQITRLHIDRVLTKARFFDKFQKQMKSRQQRVINYLFDAELGVQERSVNRNKYTGMIDESSKTAQRDLQDMVNKGMLVALPGRGRSTRYTLKLDTFTQAVTRVELATVAREFSDKLRVSAAVEYLSYEGEIEKITDRLLVQRVAKNHLIVHRKDHFSCKKSIGERVFKDYLLE